MRPPPPARSVLKTAAIGATGSMEDTMRLLTYLELTHCTKAELWDLYCRALLALSELPEGSGGRANALLNIRRVRLFLARRPGYTRPLAGSPAP
jgi:hypothetical protein